MDANEALNMVAGMLGDGPRFQHTKRVVKTGLILADRFGVDKKKLELAAWFHDFAKLMPVEKLRSILLQSQEDPRLLQYHAELWHGPAACELLFKQQLITDAEILNAIRYHTTGRANMTELDKVLYVADYIEPGRSFPGLEEVQQMAQNDLDKALLCAVRNTIKFLAEKGSAIFPDTFEAYNYYILKGGINV